LQEVIKEVPKDLDNYLEVRMQPACGRCNYLDDCKESLGMKSKDPSKWDVRLLPYVSQSIAEQLIKNGLKTINDVANNVMGLPAGLTPGPLYPQKPLLALKSNSLLTQRTATPKKGQIHSLTLPRYNNLTIILDIETDPINERVFVAGIRFTMSVARGAAYEKVFDDWWGIWKEYLQEYRKTTNKRDLLQNVHERLFEILPIELITDLISFREVKTFAESLEFLWESSPFENIIILKGEDYNGRKSSQTRFSYTYIYVNGDLSDQDELELVKAIVKVFYRMTIISHMVEQSIVALSSYGNKISPSLAIFYWSVEQLEKMQELLQRNFEALALDPSIRHQFNTVIDWLSPKDSIVPDPNQFKKLYDLRAFVETTRGLPLVINYTWHEIADSLFGIKSSMKYWTPHFNYMDFQVWHEYLNEKNMNDKMTLFKEISRQLAHKLRTIDNLRINFQRESRYLISQMAQPVRSWELGHRSYKNIFHDLAYMWYLFSRLNATVQELECTDYRTTYPELSIGKLVAGQVTNLDEIAFGDSYEYSFTLEGLSSNMKLGEGDYVYLVPFELRDNMGSPYDWLVIIEDMVWDVKNNCYKITTRPRRKSLLQLCQEKHPDSEPEWFLYPQSSDAWSNKLIGGTRRRPGLLECFDQGYSWLGRRLGFIWQLKPEDRLSCPTKLEFQLPEIYMYAPEFLPVKERPINSLITTIEPHPDPSQERAIIQSINNTISSIQGPPGTGKSQTIAALIDEILNRSEGPVRILVTAFSYPALRVVVDKLQQSKDRNGRPTKAALVQKVFIRSSSQAPYKKPDNSPDTVLDLTKIGSKWMLEGRTSINSRNRLDFELEESYIITANAHQLFNLRDRMDRGELRNITEDFTFDVIIVDEASQLPPDYFLACLEYLKNKNVEFSIDNLSEDKDYFETQEEIQSLRMVTRLREEELTKVVIVGDHNQLPPVQPVKPPKKLKNVLGSLFSYYVEGHKLRSSQLEINYRSHKDIVAFTSRLGFYENLRAFEKIKDRTIEPKNKKVRYPSELIKEAMDPEKVVCTIIHSRDFEVAVSPLEAEIVVQLIESYYQMMGPVTEEEQRKFWQEEVGIVAPHNAQGRLIIRKTFERIVNDSNNVLEESELMALLKATIYSVEKFQGSDRTVIIASIGISSKDQLSAEEDFIYEINRFNVLTSRAKRKVILVCSKNFLEYFPKNLDTMNHSAKIRDYALNYCNNAMTVTTLNENGGLEEVIFRWKSRV
ncbi:MAG: AAA domain-containing protein, partial [Candidatus Hodarchaeales archaeon]